jgi:anaerobic selenocysteine-containing dehydrogenase
MAGKYLRRISRREFIQTSTLGTAALLGCSRAEQQETGTLQVDGACAHDCPDSCSWIVTTENGRAVALEANAEHPMTRGTLCEKMDGFLTDVVYNPDRLLYPLRRVGEKGLSGDKQFERVSWDEALDDVASRLKTIIAEHGPTAILPYSFAGTEGMVQSYSLDRRFFARLGATRLERNICGSTTHAGVAATLGTSTCLLPEDIRHSRFIMIWGSNPVVTNPHGWLDIEQAKRDGARVVVIDPLRTETAERADWHLRPIPGTDAALALGMMHVIVSEGLQDAKYIESYTLDFDRLRERLAQYPADKVAAITGVDAKDIVELAKAYATTQPAAIRTQIAMEKHSNGAMMYRTVACLPALVGAWRHRGGGLLQFSSQFFDEALNLQAVMMPELEDSKTRAVNMVQLGRALTDKDLGPPIQALIVYNSNPGTIAQNQNLVFKGLKRDDLLTVVLDHFVTDTAAYADYIFPVTTQAEHLDLIVPWGSRHLSLNVPAIEPQGEALPNTEFFRRLARRLDLDEPYLHTSDEELIETALNSGHPYLEGITYERLQRDGWATLNLPEPWLPFAKGGFPTPSGKCEFYAESLKEHGMDPLPTHVPPEGDPSEAEAGYPLTFMSPKSTRYFLNSSHANQPRHLRAAGEPHLQLHPSDASPRHIKSGDKVRVYNGRGSIELTAVVDDGTLPHVVTMPHGWWASLLPGGSSANALTPDGLSDLGGGGAFYDAKVEVEKIS